MMQDLDDTMPPLACATQAGWEILSLSDLSKIAVTVREITEDRFKDGLQRCDTGSEDLGVLHLAFGGDVGILEFVDQLVAQRFDLPTRFLAVEYRQSRKALLKSLGEDCGDGDEILDPLAHRIITRHDVIPRSTWIETKLKAKQRQMRRLAAA